MWCDPCIEKCHPKGGNVNCPDHITVIEQGKRLRDYKISKRLGSSARIHPRIFNKERKLKRKENKLNTVFINYKSGTFAVPCT